MHRKTIAATLALSVVAMMGTAHAAGSIEISSVTGSGDTLTVSGTATFTDQPFEEVGSDPAADAPAGFDQLGGDLRGLAFSATLDGDVKLRIQVATQGPVLGGAPGIVHGTAFCVSGGSCYELDIQRFTTASDGNLPTAARVGIYRCATPACEEAGQTHVDTNWYSTFYGGGSITTTLSPALGATSGRTLTAAGTGWAAFSAPGSVDPRAIARTAGDTQAAMAPYVVPTRQVSVAVAEAGLDPSTVGYGAPVTPNGAGAWSASADVAGVSGAVAVYAKACFGANNCAYATQPISL